jgi:hypothetical protein
VRDRQRHPLCSITTVEIDFAVGENATQNLGGTRISNDISPDHHTHFVPPGPSIQLRSTHSLQFSLISHQTTTPTGDNFLFPNLSPHLADTTFVLISLLVLHNLSGDKDSPLENLHPLRLKWFASPPNKTLSISGKISTSPACLITTIDISYLSTKLLLRTLAMIPLPARQPISEPAKLFWTFWSLFLPPALGA